MSAPGENGRAAIAELGRLVRGAQRDSVSGILLCTGEPDLAVAIDAGGTIAPTLDKVRARAEAAKVRGVSFFERSAARLRVVSGSIDALRAAPITGAKIALIEG